MRFSDIIGHEELKERLRRVIASGRVPHAQLFSGAAGRGALPLALAYVQYLNCPNRSEEDSCGACPSCVQMEALAHPDLHIVMPVNKQGKKSGEVVLSESFMPLFRSVMEREKGYIEPSDWWEAMDLGKTLKGVISAREADEVIRRLSFKSFTGGYKAMIIWLPEMMNEQAANKLLKILEEPWAETIFILVSQSPEQLLTTIRSRTLAIEIPPIEERDLIDYMEQRGIASDSAQRHSFAHLAGGDLRELQRTIEGNGEGNRGEQFSLFTSLMRLSYNDRHLELLTWAEEVATLTRTNQIELLHYFVTMLREAYIRHAGLEQLCYTWGEEATFCTKFAPFIGNENIERLVAECESAIAQISQSANPTIMFTHFALAVSKEIKRA